MTQPDPTRCKLKNLDPTSPIQFSATNNEAYDPKLKSFSKNSHRGFSNNRFSNNRLHWSEDKNLNNHTEHASQHKTIMLIKNMMHICHHKVQRLH